MPISSLSTVTWHICIVCLFWVRCCAGSWGWAVNETQSLPEQSLHPVGRVTWVMRRLLQLRSKLPWEHTCIHTEGASLAGVVGSIYTRLVLATSSNSPQAQNLLTYSGLQVPLCPVVSIFSWKEHCLPRKTQKPCRSSPCFSLLFGNICWIIEKATEFQKNIYFCFIDYSKAFDYVDHNKLWKILKEMGVSDHLTCLFSLSCIGEGNGNPLHCSCLENPRDGWAWWAAVYGVAQSRTLLKWLSSSSSRPASWETCMQVRKQQLSLDMEQQTCSK